MDLEIVDSHVHFWSPQTHPWLVEAAKKGGAPLGSFTAPEYSKEVAGHNVTQCVHIEAAWPAGDPVGETKWLDEIANSNPAGFPQALVGFADLSSTHLDEILQGHCKFSRFRGIRQMLNYHPDKPQYSLAPHDNYLTDPAWIKGFGLLEKYNLSFELQVLPHQMHRAAEVVKQYPNVMVMVDHCGLPYEKDEASTKLWKEGLEELARYPNVYCKVSGVFTADPSWSVQTFVETSVKPCLETPTVSVGIVCVFASNFPVDRLKGTFSELITALELILAPYSLQEKQKLFAENAKTFYRLN